MTLKQSIHIVQFFCFFIYVFRWRNTFRPKVFSMENILWTKVFRAKNTISAAKVVFFCEMTHKREEKYARNL